MRACTAAANETANASAKGAFRGNHGNAIFHGQRLVACVCNKATHLTVFVTASQNAANDRGIFYGDCIVFCVRYHKARVTSSQGRIEDVHVLYKQFACRMGNHNGMLTRPGAVRDRCIFKVDVLDGTACLCKESNGAVGCCVCQIVNRVIAAIKDTRKGGDGRPFLAVEINVCTKRYVCACVGCRIGRPICQLRGIRNDVGGFRCAFALRDRFGGRAVPNFCICAVFSQRAEGKEGAHGNNHSKAKQNRSDFQFHTFFSFCFVKISICLRVFNIILYILHKK